MDPQPSHTQGKAAETLCKTDRDAAVDALKEQLREETRLRIRAEKMLRESEERYRALVEIAPIETVIVDGQGRITQYNLAMEPPPAGMPKIGDVLFRDWDWAPSGGEQMYLHLLDCIGRGESEEFAERPCGDRILHFKIAPVFEGAIVTAIDVSDRKRAEEELLKSRGHLQQAQKMEALGTLVAGVAHEINNPINLIIYNIPLLKKVFSDMLPVIEAPADTGPARKYGGLTVPFLRDNLGQLISDMDMAANRVAKIVSDLKNFARRSDTADKAPTDLNRAVENALRLARTYVRKSRARIETHLEDGLPSVEANSQHIEQVVVNILINAVQSTKPGNGHIRIESGLAPGGGRVFFSVSDNGKGIDKDMAKRLFDPFVTDKPDEGGTGLGLSVSYNLVQANDGEISFTSRAGQGATFTASFPAAGRRREARILVVDDDLSIRQLLTRALNRNGAYTVETAANGIEACIRIGSFRPDLLILDIFMPDMDGLEVCRAIRRDPALSGVKVLISTGFPEHKKLAEVAGLGFREVHPKPFRLAELLKSIETLLDDPAENSPAAASDPPA